jgi:type I restriction enzyme M protein
LRAAAPEEQYEIMVQLLFPRLRSLGGTGASQVGRHLQDARFTIPSPALLARVVDSLDGIQAEDRDTERELFDYMLGKMTKGGMGQYGTPQHIAQLMVEMMTPHPDDFICDPACGTAGLLVAASQYVRRRHPKMVADAERRKHFDESMFHGFDHDRTMVWIGDMNLLLHGVEKPDMRQRDSLAADDGGDVGQYSLVLTNPPFAGTRDLEQTSGELVRVVSTRKIELLFLAAVLRLLKAGGRAAVIVPEGVLFGSTRAHIEMRRRLVEEHKLEGVVRLPTATFRPYAGISTAILIFTKTNAGGTDHVWFY